MGSTPAPIFVDRDRFERASKARYDTATVSSVPLRAEWHKTAVMHVGMLK
jgi:hypothetical protein